MSIDVVLTFTVMSSFLIIFSACNVILTFPGDIPLISPVDDTVAIFSSPDTYFMAGFVAFEGRMFAVSDIVPST